MSNSAPNFGSCWSCITDLVMPSVMATGFLVIGQAIARRWQTPRGALVGDANYGYDLTDYVSDDLGKGDIARIAHQAGAEALKDERVLTCDATITLISGLMMVSAKIGTALGPFLLVVSVDQLNVTLLKAA